MICMFAIPCIAFTSTKRVISPFNGPILIIQTPALIIIIHRVAANASGARLDTWRCGRFTLMHSLAQKHNISPFNGPILTVQTSALLFILVCKATIAGGGL
jgi:hypothetical protein